MSHEAGPFTLRTVVHLEGPAGLAAADLATLRDGIAAAPRECLFQHVTRIPVRHPHARDLPANDFARWVGIALQDAETSERLAIAGAPGVTPLEELRASLLAVLDAAPASRRRAAAPDEAAFHFIRARSIPVPLLIETRDALEAVEAWTELDPAAVFFHLVEARTLGPEEAWLPGWLRALGETALADAAEEMVGRGRPMGALQRELGTRWRRSLITRRLARRADAPESVRRREAHQVVARLARRLREADRPPGDEPA